MTVKPVNAKNMRKKFAHHYFMSICMTDAPLGEELEEAEAPPTELPQIQKKSASITFSQAEYASSAKISEVLRTSYGIN